MLFGQKFIFLFDEKSPDTLALKNARQDVFRFSVGDHAGMMRADHDTRCSRPSGLKGTEADFGQSELLP